MINVKEEVQAYCMVMTMRALKIKFLYDLYFQCLQMGEKNEYTVRTL
jgi:hypothetical protein